MPRTPLAAFFLACLLACPAWAETPIKVAFINTLVDPADEPIWSLFDAGYIRSSQAAAKQLNIDFRVIPAFRPETMVAETERLANGPDRPDYLIITIHRGVGTRLLEIAEKAKLPVFVINAGLLEPDRQRVGGPREHYKYWIGQMLPDDEAAGYALAKLLVERAKRDPQLNHQGRVSLVAFSGREVDGAAVQRDLGLQRAVREDPTIDLVQVVPGNWDRRLARAKIPLVLQRYPEVTAVWTGNDGMAMGSLNGLLSIHRQPGTDIVIGGMNWDADAMHALAEGQLTATMGGHFLECAWALVLLCDYHHGLDFASERIDWHSEMRALTQENVREYMTRLESMDWSKADYRHLSKYFNPERKAYHFSLDEVLAPAVTSDASRTPAPAERARGASPTHQP
jgi:ABC-type sugar transport system substrate-binding protein